MNEILARLGVHITQEAMLRFSQKGLRELAQIKEALGCGTLDSDAAWEDADPASNLVLRAYLLMVLQERGIDDPDMSPDDVRKLLAQSLG